MKEKQQQLTFNKGITNVPSDALCSDNALAESIGMVYDDSEHRVIQKPVDFMTGLTGKTLLYVHEYNDQKRYIVKDGTSIKWGTNVSGAYTEDSTSLTTVSGTPNVTSIGKTLIIADDSGLQYFLWTYDYEHNSNPIYEFLGSTLPNPEVSFLFNDYTSAFQESGRAGDILHWYSGASTFGIVDGKQMDWNNLIVGLYSSLRKKVWQAKCFHGSFCVRAALELYDGSYAYVSNPVFMLNHFSEYGVAWINAYSPPTVKMYMHGQRLRYRFNQDYSKWADIVKNVVLFVTREAATLDSVSDAICIRGNNPDESGGTPLPADTPINYRMTYASSSTGVSVVSNVQTLGDDQIGDDYLYRVLKPIPDTELENTIKEGVYYKLCEIGTIGSDEWKNASDHFDTHTLENITTQEQLGDEDFYSHCPLKAGVLYSYNSRLNIANVSRGFFDGFSNFMPFDNNLRSGMDPLPAPTYRFRVTIHTDAGQVVVEKTKQTYQKQGIYFYYPDPRARHVDIYKDNTQILHQDMTEHPNLNGAYYFAGVSPTMDEPLSVVTPHTPTVSIEPFEKLSNYVIQSETNNPFVFKAAGYFKVGTGKILAMSSVTQALSEGQFGQFPLLVFSESGIWALAVASTGYYSSVHPISREVSNDPPCLIQTDGAVFFTSKKGLMVVVGSQVKCVSEQMSGKTNVFKDGSNVSLVTDLGDFVDYLKSAYIAYDYRDSLLWIFNSNYTTCYTYSIKSGTFSKFTPSTKITNVVNCYPDYLLQDSTKAYSLMGRKDINKDGTTSSDIFTPNRYSACILTRPMKLENALALKSIMQVKHIHDIPNLNGANVSDPTLTLRIFASNNLKNWTELTSLRGIPWKYYRFRFDFANLIATDRFAGTMLITQERRIDKLR